MITANVKINNEGFDYLKRGSAINRAARIAINKASAVTKAKLVYEEPVDRGYLAKSIRIKVVLHTKKKGSGFTTVIGPSQKYVRKGKKYKKGKHKGEKRIIRPSRYAHLVERKYHVTQRAFDATKEQFVVVLERAIVDEMRKAMSKVR